MTLDLHDITVVLGAGVTRTTILDNLDLSVTPGELTALTGPSGSGKSTLLAVAGALLRPTSGRVLLDDVDLARLDDAHRARYRRERIGYVFQTGNLLPNLNAVDQLLTVTYILGRRTRRYRSRAEEALAAVGLADRLGHRPEQMSGGERQRVALARALFAEPTLLLIDEPTAAVDRSRAVDLARLLRDTAHTRACVTLVATHDPVVTHAADRVIDLERVSKRVTAIPDTAGRP